MFRKLTDLTDRKTRWMPTKDKIIQLNRLLRGWGNYFRVGSVAKAYRAVDHHVRRELQ